MAPLAAIALLAASPSPDPSARPAATANPQRSVTITCKHTPLWIFVPGNQIPSHSSQSDATLGQRFGLVSGPRTTLEGNEYYETDIVVIEPGLPNEHYWVLQRCVSVS